MDLSGIVVVGVLTALSLAAIGWMEMQSRRTQRKEVAADDRLAFGHKKKSQPYCEA